MNALDLMPCGSRLLAIQLRRGGAGQSPLRAVHNRHNHLQIAQQFGSGRGALWARSFLLRLPLCFEKQPGILENAFADRWRTFAPRSVQLAGYTRIAVVLGENRCHSLAIFQILAGHRYQELQRHLRRDLALAHLPLNRFRQNLHQRQPPRYPAHTAVEPARQLVEAVVEASLQLRQ